MSWPDTVQRDRKQLVVYQGWPHGTRDVCVKDVIGLTTLTNKICSHMLEKVKKGSYLFWRELKNMCLPLKTGLFLDEVKVKKQRIVRCHSIDHLECLAISLIASSESTKKTGCIKCSLKMTEKQKPFHGLCQLMAKLSVKVVQGEQNVQISQL